MNRAQGLARTQHGPKWASCRTEFVHDCPDDRSKPQLPSNNGDFKNAKSVTRVEFTLAGLDLLAASCGRIANLLASVQRRLPDQLDGPRMFGINRHSC